MSQKTSRKSQNATVVNEDKEKVDSPVKEMKKKVAANAEKDKQTAEKADKPVEKNDKTEPAEKHKAADKTDKHTDKPEKADKSGDKKADKTVEKKTEQVDKEENKGDKNKEKGAKAHNGTHNGAAAAAGDDANGTVSDDSEGLVIEEDEMFPELTYDDSETDAEHDAPSRSHTRRSQVKATKTPETPRPASEKESEDSKESKLLKMKDDTTTSDRKLRSADSPKPETKKDKKPQESPKKQDAGQEEEKKGAPKKDLEGEKTEEAQKDDKKTEQETEKPGKVEVEIMIEVENAEGSISRTRARVSPYSRSRLERTCTSVTADYTGNNSTMETSLDLTETTMEEPSLNDSDFLRGIRSIRGRNSYKLLTDVKFTNPNHNRPRPQPVGVGRPTGAVVGRKRRPSPEVPARAHTPAHTSLASADEADDMFVTHTKRMKLFDRLSISMPFRRNVSRHNAEIVGINTDLPLTAPIASTSFDSFDPESIKPAPSLSDPIATPLPTPTQDRNASRCLIM